jgi:hypothetical protein
VCCGQRPEECSGEIRLTSYRVFIILREYFCSLFQESFPFINVVRTLAPFVAVTELWVI